MLKFILILLIIFFAIRIIGRMFITSTFNNLNKRFEEELKQRQNFSQQQPPRPEGQVTVDTSKASRKKSDNGEGEYVDFEEVK